MKKLFRHSMLVVAILVVTSLVLAVGACAKPAPAPSPSPTPTPAPAPKVYTLVAETVYPPTHYLNLTMIDWEKLCTEYSNGQLQFEHYPAEQLFKALEALDATSRGSLD